MRFDTSDSSVLASWARAKCARPQIGGERGQGRAVPRRRSKNRKSGATGWKKVAEKAVRQSLSLPPRLAKHVGSMAKNRKLSKNRMLLELIENGIDAEERRQQQFFALAERFRNEQDPEAANRLGDELGKMVFGG
jgi:hypothetical protein